MNRNIWFDLKQKFFKSGGPLMFYIILNVSVFIVIELIKAISSKMGYGDLFEEQVIYHLAFPATSSLWLSHIYTIITFQFIDDNFFHLLFNMIWLYLAGRILMDFIKPRQFHFIYLLGGVAGALFFGLYSNVSFFKPLPYIALTTASTAVMAIFASLATLVPNYNLRLMFIGNIKVKYLFLIYLIPNLISVAQGDFGTGVTHLGAALLGFGYIKILQNGNDLSAIFKKKPKLKVVRSEKNPRPSNNVVNQKEIDAILDKISKTGYDKLSKTEKDTLFKASKN